MRKSVNFLTYVIFDSSSRPAHYFRSVQSRGPGHDDHRCELLEKHVGKSGSFITEK